MSIEKSSVPLLVFVLSLLHPPVTKFLAFDLGKFAEEGVSFERFAGGRGP